MLPAARLSGYRPRGTYSLSPPVTAKISSAKKSHPAHSNRRSHSNSRNKRDSVAASVIERIAPGHPAQNGRHERMHLTLKTDATRPAAHNVLQQQMRFDTFGHRFNHERLSNPRTRLTRLAFFS